MKRNVLYAICIVFINTFYPLVIFPYISRVFSIELVGTYNYYNLLFAYLVILSNFGINLYGSKEIGRLKDDVIGTKRVTTELFFINIVNAFLIFLVFVLPLFFYVNPSERTLVGLFSLTIFSSAISMEWFFVGKEKQGFVLVRNIVIKVLSIIFIFIFVKTHEDFLYYVLIVVGGLLVNSFINISLIIKNLSFKYLSKNILLHYKILSATFFIEACFRYFGMGDVAILEKLISRENLGFITFSLSIYNISSSVLKIIATTLLPRASYYIETKNSEQFEGLINKSISFMFFAGIPICGSIFLLSNLIVEVLGGDKFIFAANILRGFVPLILISSIINVLVFQYLFPLGKSRIVIKIYIVAILINVSLNIFLSKQFPIFSFVICSIISHLLILFYFLMKENCWRFIKNDIVRYLKSSFLPIIIVIFCLVTFKITTFHMTVYSIIFIVLFYLSLYYLRDPIIKNFLNILKIKLNK